MPLKTILTTVIRTKKICNSYKEESAPKVLNGHWTGISHSVMLLWKSYWLYLNKSGIRRLTEDAYANHLFQLLAVNSVVWCWSKMKPIVHQFNHMDPDQHWVSSCSCYDFDVLTSCGALTSKTYTTMPHFSNLPTVQPSKDQMTLSFPHSASSLQEVPAPSTLPCQKPSKNALENGTLEKWNTVEQDKLKSWQKVE